MGSINLVEALPELRIPAHVLDPWFFTKHVKGSECTARSRVTEGRVWEGLKHRSFCPHGVWGAATLAAFWFTVLEVFQAPSLGVLGRLHYIGTID